MHQTKINTFKIKTKMKTAVKVTGRFNEKVVKTMSLNYADVLGASEDTMFFASKEDAKEAVLKAFFADATGVFVDVCDLLGDKPEFEFIKIYKKDIEKSPDFLGKIYE